ncbi:MAG: phosphoribosylformylglycinamidine synthase, partial [Lachnospiraceae bacterium]|nr:phosphoribosylformylglycinamidine synthase [Lachnospiraceae bacterium]
MNSDVKRIYVEKKAPYAVAARKLKEDVTGFLGITGVKEVRKLIRYDVENISDEVFETACRTVFSEPPVDILYKETFPMPEGARVFSVEPLPGQFDQRADSAVQCVQFLREEEEPVIKTAETYILTGEISDEDMDRIVSYCINPVDSRETGLEKPETLRTDYPQAEDVQTLAGFTGLDERALKDLYMSLGLAMTFADFSFVQEYYAGTEH